MYMWATVMALSDSFNNSLWTDTSKIRQGICSQGWHVPFNAEWTRLTDTVVGSSTVGTKLKAVAGWTNSGNGTDDYGMRLLPAGMSDASGWGSRAGWVTEFAMVNQYDSANTIVVCFEDSYAFSFEMSASKEVNFSLRCLKDTP
jgi:uncharacterized protein (TIGR02145 family)